jgi:hypothetical protein
MAAQLKANFFALTWLVLPCQTPAESFASIDAHIPFPYFAIPVEFPSCPVPASRNKRCGERTETIAALI